MYKGENSDFNIWSNQLFDGLDILKREKISKNTFVAIIETSACLAKSKIQFINPICSYEKIIAELNRNIYTVYVGVPLYYNKLYKEISRVKKIRLLLNAGGKVSEKVI